MFLVKALNDATYSGKSFRLTDGSSLFVPNTHYIELDEIPEEIAADVELHICIDCEAALAVGREFAVGEETVSDVLIRLRDDMTGLGRELLTQFIDGLGGGSDAKG